MVYKDWAEQEHVDVSIAVLPQQDLRSWKELEW